MQNSGSFSRILEIVLVLGNYMNGTSSRGGALGFKLSSMNKLVDTKASNNKVSLLNFIVGVVEKKFPEVLSLIDESKCFEEASKGILHPFFCVASCLFFFFSCFFCWCAVPLQSIQSDTNEVKNGANAVQKALEGLEEAEGDRFREVFTISSSIFPFFFFFLSFSFSFSFLFFLLPWLALWSP